MAHSSTMAKLGSPTPDFNLKNWNPLLQHESYELDSFKNQTSLLVAFFCNHCPYVVGSEERIENAASRARELGMGFVGINSNDPIMYESDNWDSMVKRAGKGMSYAYLHDETQAIAHAYGAERTPEFYLLDSTGSVVYRGRMDDSPRNPMDATTDELGDAMSALAAGNTIVNARTDSIGCSVKWKQ